MKDCEFCNDEKQEKTLTCFRCGEHWEEPTDTFDRMKRCPIHSVVDRNKTPDLCRDCRDLGYYLERDFNRRFFDNSFVIKQTPSNGTKLNETKTAETNVTDEPKMISVHQFKRIDREYDSDDSDDIEDYNLYSDSDDDCQYINEQTNVQTNEQTDSEAFNQSTDHPIDQRQKRLKTVR